jgi:hypothetical protein
VVVQSRLKAREMEPLLVMMTFRETQKSPPKAHKHTHTRKAKGLSTRAQCPRVTVSQTSETVCVFIDVFMSSVLIFG